MKKDKRGSDRERECGAQKGGGQQSAMKGEKEDARGGAMGRMREVAEQTHPKPSPAVQGEGEGWQAEEATMQRSTFATNGPTRGQRSQAGKKRGEERWTVKRQGVPDKE